VNWTIFFHSCGDAAPADSLKRPLPSFVDTRTESVALFTFGNSFSEQFALP
jgi:hypothetical protein